MFEARLPSALGSKEAALSSVPVGATPSSSSVNGITTLLTTPPPVIDIGVHQRKTTFGTASSITGLADVSLPFFGILILSR